MTDDPDLSPEQEREVRRLLADARHTEPMPGDVAARLDRVLAELARTSPDAGTPVTVLASRRRQRVTSLLVAAAAVVAVGVGLGQVVGTGSGDDDGAGADTAVSSVDEAAPEAAAKPDNGQDAGGSGAPRGSASTPAYAVTEPRPIRPGRFSRDVLAVQELASRATPAELQSGTSSSSDAGFECTPADWGAGTFVPVTYGGDPGVLVFRRPDGDSQVVDLFQCGSAEVLRSITLPAP